MRHRILLNLAARPMQLVPRALVLAGTIAFGVGCDGGEPKRPTELASVGSTAITSVPNIPVSVAPSVTLTDQGGRGLAKVLVRWRVGDASGAVSNDSSFTDSRGVASSGGWRLGIRAGLQTLTATVEAISPVVFVATVSPGAPDALLRQSAETQSAVVGQRVTSLPSVQVQDVFANPISGQAVVFTVLDGTSTVSTQTLVTNASGSATLPDWRLGTSTSLAQRVTVLLSATGASVSFLATALPDSAVRLEAASPTQQDGVPALGVTTRPTVRSLDRFGNPTGGVSVTFSPAVGSGTVTGSIRVTTLPEGTARVGEWVLSDSATQTLVARAAQLPADSVVFRANAVESVFFIQPVFVRREPSTRNLLAVERAITRWRRMIAGQLEPAQVIASANDCGPGTPALNEVITNVRIYINFDSIDGPGSILGRAGPCIIRTGSGLPVVGFVELDTADLANLNANGTLDDVMAHEFGHILGLQSFNWSRRGLLIGAGTTDPYFQGAMGREGFAAIGGASYTGVPVPVENTGGQGTRDSHWRFTVLRRELMVGFAQAGGMPLSRLSVGALADLGYQVRLENAELFTLPSFGSAAFGAMVSPASAVPYGDDHWPTAVWSTNRVGERRLVRAGDWRVTRLQTPR